MAATRKPRPSTRRKPAAKPRKRATAPTSPVAGIATKRNLSIAGVAIGLGAIIAGAVAWLRNAVPQDGHAAPDLEGDEHPGPGDRAPEAFRPDMDAPMTAAEREALRPPVGKPSLVADETVG